VWLPLALTVLSVAVFDARRLLALPAPQAARPARLDAVQRHALVVSLLVEGAERLTRVATSWPDELGGPVAPVTVVGAARCEVEQTATPRRRGNFALGEVWLWLTSPSGLWQRCVVTPAPCRVHVWPDVKGPGGDALGRELSDAGATRARRAASAGSELMGLRPFQPGDDPRHVDWKATARSAHPIVRQWQPDRRRWVVVVLDAGRLMRAEHQGENTLDAAVRACVRLGLAARARGDRLGVLVFTHRVLRWIPPFEGRVVAEQLVRLLADIQPSSVTSDAACVLPHLLSLGRRALLVWLTDVMDAEGARRLVASTAGASPRHLSLVALLRDPGLDEAFARPVRSEDDAYRRAAAELVARDRAGLLDSLRTRSVPALDLSMSTLALGGVPHYVEARYTAHW
jgi:uncharacterized protein (DUF58 family)